MHQPTHVEVGAVDRTRSSNAAEFDHRQRKGRSTQVPDRPNTTAGQ